MYAVLQQVSINRFVALTLAVGLAVVGFVAYFEGLPSAPPQASPATCCSIERDTLPLSRNMEAQQYFDLALLDRQMGRFDLALEAFDKAIQLDPTFTAAFFERANIGLLDRDTARIADYTRVIDLAPTYAPAYYHRGAVKYEQRWLCSAVEDFSRAVELDPSYEAAIADRGFALLLMGKAKAAQADANELVRLRPNWMQYTTRAFFRRGAGDTQGAVDDYSTAISLNPFNDHAYHDRGLLRIQQGDFVSGAIDYLRAVRLAPSTIENDFMSSPLGRWL